MNSRPLYRWCVRVSVRLVEKVARQGRYDERAVEAISTITVRVGRSRKWSAGQSAVANW